MAITIDTPYARDNWPFQISGALSGYNSPPLLTYTDDPSKPPSVSAVAALGLKKSISVTWKPPATVVTYKPLPGGSSVSKAAYMFRHPPLPQGHHTIVVTDGRTGAHIGYGVTPPWHRR